MTARQMASKRNQLERERLGEKAYRNKMAKLGKLNKGVKKKKRQPEA